MKKYVFLLLLALLVTEAMCYGYIPGAGFRKKILPRHPNYGGGNPSWGAVGEGTGNAEGTNIVFGGANTGNDRATGINYGRGYPNYGGGYPNNGGGYPNNGGGYTIYEGGYPNKGGRYPNHGGGYPNNGGGYPSNGGGYPNNGGGYPNWGAEGEGRGSAEGTDIVFGGASSGKNEAKGISVGSGKVNGTGIGRAAWKKK